MKLSTTRESLLKPLQAVIGVVERRQTMPILGNVLITAKKGTVTVAATDLEVELVASADMDGVTVPGEITVPGRKLMDIVRALAESAPVSLALEGDRFVVKSGRSRFVLATLPSAEFPLVDKVEASSRLKLRQADVQHLLTKTQFSMAQNDVRYYLNGLMLETGKKYVRAVATDGHRLAMCEISIEKQEVTSGQVIVPRKGVMELARLMGDGEEIQLDIGSNHVRATLNGIRLTSKLIDGRFPDYERVIPAGKGATLTASRAVLRQALQRVGILSNERYRGVRLEVAKNALVIQANNPDQEEAREELEVQYDGESMEIGFNVTYLLDAIDAIDTDDVQIDLVDSNSSCLIHPSKPSGAQYVVMPMRL